VLAAYLLFTVDAEAAVAALVGAAASNAYIAWLCKDIDDVRGTDSVPLWDAEEVRVCCGLCIHVFGVYVYVCTYVHIHVCVHRLAHTCRACLRQTARVKLETTGILLVCSCMYDLDVQEFY
jgi:hypothetical protein